MSKKIDRSRIDDYLDESYYRVQLESYHSRHLRDQFNNIMELVSPYEEEYILDIGTGSGKYPARMSFTAYLTATDFSPVSAKLARRTGNEIGKPDRMHFVQTRGQHLPFAANSYDKVTALDVVEHVNQEEYEAIVDDVFRVLRPGGMFCIYTPNKTYWIEYIYFLIYGRSISPLHFGLKRERELLSPLRTAGFHVQDVYYRPNYPPVMQQLERLIIPLPPHPLQQAPVYPLYPCSLPARLL